MTSPGVDAILPLLDKAFTDGQRIKTDTEATFARLNGQIGQMMTRFIGQDPRRVIEPERDYVVPMSTHTDGTWIWSGAVRYYLLRHGIAPEPDFVEHIRASDYLAAKPDEPVCREAIAQVLNS